MNKEFKTILLLGLVSILISGLGLYQFRGIKFKNTKELEKENQIKQEKLIQQYNEIVDVYIPNITDKLPENDLVTTGTINMIIPGFLENKGFYTISDKLQKEEIKLNIKKITSYQEFQNQIKSNLQNYDIALIPTNRLQGLDIQEINLGENITPYIIDIYNRLPENDSKKIIPFALDPAVTIYHNISTQQQDSRTKLFSYSLLRKSTKKYSMPLLWGYEELIGKLLQNGSTPFEYYTEILVLQIKQMKNKGDNQELSNMINTNNISLKNKYSYQNLKNIVSLLKKQSEYCETFPAICTIRYGYSDIKFGYLSDFDIIENYFPGENQLSIGNFTNSEKTYPVKGRIFVVPNGNEKTNLINKFFSEYISESIDGNETFWNHTLSAITNIYNKQKDYQFFEPMILNENIFYLYTGNIDIQNQLTNDGKTIQMLEGNYSTNSYISNFTY